MGFKGPRNCKRSPSLLYPYQIASLKKIMPGPFSLSFLAFQQSSAWLDGRGQGRFENGVYCSLSPTPQGRLPAIPNCPLSDYCRSFLGSHFPGRSGLSLALPAVKISASRCNISLGTCSPNKSELSRPSSPAPVNEVCPSSFLPSLLDDYSSSHSGDGRVITGASGLAVPGNPDLTEGDLRACHLPASSSDQGRCGSFP